MTEKSAEIAVEKTEDVDELSIIRQVKARLDKLPSTEAKNRVLGYVAGQVQSEQQKAWEAEKRAYAASKQAELDRERLMFQGQAEAAPLRTASGQYV